MITYHGLALGFIATTLKPSGSKFDKHRSREIFDTGVTTVATYLLQGILGLGITVIAALIVKDLFAAAGVLLPFGFGQGTGQALKRASSARMKAAPSLPNTALWAAEASA